MALDIHVLAPPVELPSIRWSWDPETDILSGSIPPPAHASGYTGTVELSDDDGSVVVLDVVGGVLAGLDIVVWPETIALPGLAAPVDARAAQVVVPSRAARRGIAALEIDTTLSLSADPSTRVLHLRIGTRRAVEPLRVADHFLVEVDASQRLAGFWLEQVPAMPRPAE